MANRNTVMLTFAGDAKPLKQSTTEVDTALKGVGDSADEANDRLSRIQRLAGTGGRDFGEYGRGLGGVGDRFDELDTRAMGAADGLNGINDLMNGGKLSAAEYAMVMSDFGSSMYNTVIPSLQSASKNGGEWIRSMTGAKTTLGGLGRAAVGAAGALGVGLLIDKLIEAEEARKALRVEELTEEFTALGKVEFSGLDILQGGVSKTFDKLLEQSPKLAQDYIDWMEAVSDGAAETDEFQERVDRAGDAQDRFAEVTAEAKTNLELEAEAVSAFNDELDRLLGKSFSVNEAQANLTIAMAEAAETVKANKKEIGDAATSLDVHTDAGARNALMIQGLVEAEADYLRALQESGASNVQLAGAVDQGILSLTDQLTQLGFNGDQIAIYTAVLKDVPALVRTNIGVSGVEQSIHDIGRIQAEINNLRGRDVGIRIVGTSVGFAGGGVRLMAEGGTVGVGNQAPFQIVGEKGPELMKLPTGSRVWSNGDSARMLNGGGQTINIYVQGSIRSDRDLIRLVRDELDRGGLR